MVREGYLLKQGEKGIKTWKRRWFSIRTGNGVPGRRPHLYYFDKANEVKEKGRIDLEQAIDVAPCKDSPKEFFDFAITTPKRIYRLRAATEEEMNAWVEELQKYQLEGATKLTGSFNDKRKSQMIGSASASMSRFPTLSPSSPRPQSVMPGFRIGETKPEAKEAIKPIETIAPKTSQESVPRARTPSFIEPQLGAGSSNASQVRQSVRDMRSAALQSEPARKEPERTQPVMDNSSNSSSRSWGAQEDSKELQTARKRLAKAQNLNTKYENEIRSLRDKVATLTRENSELHEKINKRENSVDFDKKRREEELEDVKQKLESEKKLREELNLQYQDVRNELRTLKESIHIVRTAPNIHALTKEPEIQSTVHTIEPPLSDATKSKRSTQVFDRPPLQTSLPRSASLSNMNSVSIVQKTGDGKRVPWVRDEQVGRCLSCKREFGLFTRKHHCRNCGLIFCSDCSTKTAKVKGYSGPERVCDKCFGSLRNAKTAQQKQMTRENPTQPRTQGYVPPKTQQVSHTRMPSEEDPPIDVIDL